MAAVETHEYTAPPVQSRVPGVAHETLGDRGWVGGLSFASPVALASASLEYMGLSTTTRYLSMMGAALIGIWMIQRLAGRRKKTNAWW